jgi:uncharacterized membrane protein YfhO
MQVCDTWAYQIAENTSVTSFGIPFTTDDITSLETLPDTGRMELQQWLSNSIYNCGTVVQRYEPTKLDQVEITEADGKTVLEKTEDSDECYLYYKIDVSGKQSLYFDCFDQASTALKEAVNDSFTVMVNGIYKESDYPSQKNNGLLYLGTFDNETVEITLQLQKDVEAKSFGVYGMDEEALAKAQSQKAVTTLERTGNTISGTVTSESDDQYLLLPLSWNSGYTATVNGENVEIYRIFDTFMAVKLSSEENEISLTYMPTGFLPGVALSIGGVVLTVVWLWIEKRKGSLQIRWLESAALVAFFVLFVVVLLVIYGMPLLFCGIPS